MGTLIRDANAVQLLDGTAVAADASGDWVFVGQPGEIAFEGLLSVAAAGASIEIEDAESDEDGVVDAATARTIGASGELDGTVNERNYPHIRVYSDRPWVRATVRGSSVTGILRAAMWHDHQVNSTATA